METQPYKAASDATTHAPNPMTTKQHAQTNAATATTVATIDEQNIEKLQQATSAPVRQHRQQSTGGIISNIVHFFSSIVTGLWSALKICCALPGQLWPKARTDQKSAVRSTALRRQDPVDTSKHTADSVGKHSTSEPHVSVHV